MLGLTRVETISNGGSVEEIEIEKEEVEKSKIKRFFSLDFIRGFAIWAMVFLHAVSNMYDTSWALNLSSLLQMNPAIIVSVGLLAYLGTFAGLFLLVSISVNVYAAHRNLKRGHKPELILAKQVLVGFLVLFIAFLTETVLIYEGLLGRLIYQRDTSIVFFFYRAFHFETLHTIAWCIIINGILHYFIVLRPASKNKNYFLRTVIIYLVIIVAIIVATPFVNMGITNFFENRYGIDWNVDHHGADYDVGQWTLPLTGGVGEFFLRRFFIFLNGHLEPMFPFLATGTIGALIGTCLSQEKPPKRLPLFLLIGTLVSLLCGITVILITGEFVYTFFRPGMDMYFLSLFGQLGIMTLFIYLIEYRGYTKRFTRWSRYWRRFGMVSLTVYSLQVVDAVPRYLIQYFTGLFAILIKSNLNFSITTPMEVGWQVVPKASGIWWQVIITALIILAWWSLLIWLWEKINFIGSLEWMITSLSSLAKRIPASSRLNPKKIIYEAEPIVFRGIWNKNSS